MAGLEEGIGQQLATLRHSIGTMTCQEADIRIIPASRVREFVRAIHPRLASRNYWG
jgi:hypothetical protein